MSELVPLCLFVILVTCSLVDSKCARPSMLIVSFDGFRYDYFSKNVTSNMLRLRSRGTYADHMENVFPTKTFPNHQSIATGMYPEVHGVLGPKMYNPTLGREFAFDEMWNFNKDIVPIWTLNEKAAGDCHSGTVMWPGSNQIYQNVPATFHLRFNTSMTWKDRVDTFILWYKDPRTPVNLVVAYFEQPDYTSHRYGPDSVEVLGQIRRVDEISDYIDRQLCEKNLTDVNVVMLSDHGMDAVNNSHVIKIGKTINNVTNTHMIVGTSPMYHIWPLDWKDEKKVDFLYNAFKTESKSLGHFSVYRKDEIPVAWHYKDNDLTPPILIVADEGYAFQDLLALEVANRTVNTTTWGIHGYATDNEKMWPFFMAWGPDIKVDHSVPVFKTVDLYYLFAKVLELESPTNNGTLSNVQDILRKTAPEPESPMSIGAAIGITVLVLCIIGGGLIIAYLMRRADKKRPRRNDVTDLDPTRAKPEENPLMSGGQGDARNVVV